MSLQKLIQDAIQKLQTSDCNTLTIQDSGKNYTIIKASRKNDDGQTENVFYVYDHNNKLGEGSYGKVYRGWQIDTSQGTFTENNVAIKIISEYQRRQGSIQKEARLQKLFYPAKTEDLIVQKQLSSTSNDVTITDQAIIITEYIEGSSLKDLATCILTSSLSMSQKTTVVTQFLLWLSKVHTHYIIHNDLHPGNILLSKENPPVKYATTEKERFNANIIDFGLSIEPTHEVIADTRHYQAEDVYRVAPLIKGILSAGNQEQQASLQQNSSENDSEFPDPQNGLDLKTITKGFLDLMQQDNPDSRPTTEQALRFWNTLNILCRACKKPNRDQDTINLYSAKLILIASGFWSEKMCFVNDPEVYEAYSAIVRLYIAHLLKSEIITILLADTERAKNVAKAINSLAANNMLTSNILQLPTPDPERVINLAKAINSLAASNTSRDKPLYYLSLLINTGSAGQVKNLITAIITLNERELLSTSIMRVLSWLSIAASDRKWDIGETFLQACLNLSASNTEDPSSFTKVCTAISHLSSTDHHFSSTGDHSLMINIMEELLAIPKKNNKNISDNKQLQKTVCENNLGNNQQNLAEVINLLGEQKLLSTVTMGILNGLSPKNDAEQDAAAKAEAGNAFLNFCLVLVNDPKKSRFLLTAIVAIVTHLYQKKLLKPTIVKILSNSNNANFSLALATAINSLDSRGLLTAGTLQILLPKTNSQEDLSLSKNINTIINELATRGLLTQQVIDIFKSLGGQASIEQQNVAKIFLFACAQLVAHPLLLNEKLLHTMVTKATIFLKPDTNKNIAEQQAKQHAATFLFQCRYLQHYNSCFFRKNRFGVLDGQVTARNYEAIEKQAKEDINTGKDTRTAQVYKEIGFDTAAPA